MTPCARFKTLTRPLIDQDWKLESLHADVIMFPSSLRELIRLAVQARMRVV